MGRKDAVTKRFCSDRVRFADLVNGVYFDGRSVIHSEDLTVSGESYTQPLEYTGQEEKRQYQERVRDIKMLHKYGSTIRILAIEHQSYIDYGMPVRCMEYDVLEYRKQMEELKAQNLQEKRLSTSHERLCGMRKTDRLWPTYTLCLYLGEEPWDGPRSLQDMMDFGEDAGDMKELFADYPFRLYCVNEEHDFSMFHTQLRCVFELLPLRKDKKRLLEKLTGDEAYSHMDEDSLEFLSVVMDNPAIWKKRHKFKKSEKETEDTGKNKEEEYDMCQAIRELIEDGKQEGLSEGIKVGRSEGIKEGRLDALKQSVENLMKSLSISLEKACELLGSSQEDYEVLRQIVNR
ncbi:MAG: Rpn family recombination-promoting nuclease/putative transposase [Lachnospiraceae bacterium]|nr:Rpn family recombination-promoting nuclease/putative transposase [Lachnospiraceae bacterium]